MRTRTTAQTRQWRLRHALGALSMISNTCFSSEKEDAEDWVELVRLRDRLLERARLRSALAKLRTRAGHLRFPAWDHEYGVAHAHIAGRSLCGASAGMPPRRGSPEEQPVAGEDPEQHCPRCLEIAGRGGVLQLKWRGKFAP